VGEVLEALARADMPSSVSKDGALVVDGAEVPVEIQRLTVVTLAVARGLPDPPRGVVGIVIADRISEDARRELAARGWGWVDRRGHLRLWTKGLRIAAEIEPLRSEAPSERFASVFPPVGIEVALALLREPARDWIVTELAAHVGRSAGGVSERLRALRQAGLVDRRNRPIVPDLFWELVGPWHERPVALASFPGLGGPFEQLSWLGLPTDWVLTDTQAALLLGAPVIASSDGPPDFYVPQPSMVEAAVSHFGPARGQPAATVRPIRYAGVHTEAPFQRNPSGIQVAHPVVVALDLAHDRARGREVVEVWDPTALGVTRVW
jgi:DNA-binding transcriptional ArsR family regulator